MDRPKEAIERIRSWLAGNSDTDNVLAYILALQSDFARERRLRELGWSNLNCPICDVTLAGKMENYATVKAELESMTAHAEALDSCVESMIASKCGRLWNWPETAYETQMKNLKEAHDAYRAAHPKDAP